MSGKKNETRDEVLRRLLKTPPTPHASPSKRSKKIDPDKLKKLMKDPKANLQEIAREIGTKED